MEIDNYENKNVSEFRNEETGGLEYFSISLLKKSQNKFTDEFNRCENRFIQEEKKRVLLLSKSRRPGKDGGLFLIDVVLSQNHPVFEPALTSPCLPTLQRFFFFFIHADVHINA